MNRRLGVIIGRFQVPELHTGHRYLINYARGHSDDLLILLGTSEAFPTLRNPLPYPIREVLIRESYPEAIIGPIPDHPSDEKWSKNLDTIITSRFPDHQVTLYGSRDSFIPHYSGRFPCVIAPQITAPSGTDVRRGNQLRRKMNRDFRNGVIYAQSARLPISYQTVDIAVLRHEDASVLLGKKLRDGGKMRFIGGFVDPQQDATLEDAALRELTEEAGQLSCHEIRYLGSYRVKDFRYGDDADQVMTAFFVTYILSGIARAGDDLDDIGWFPITEAPALVVPDHVPLARRLSAFITGTR